MLRPLWPATAPVGLTRQASGRISPQGEEAACGAGPLGGHGAAGMASVSPPVPWGWAVSIGAPPATHGGPRLDPWRGLWDGSRGLPGLPLFPVTASWPGLAQGPGLFQTLLESGQCSAQPANLLQVRGGNCDEFI